MSWLGLLRIEVRRNLGLWLLVPLTVLTIWTTSNYLRSTVWLWGDTSLALRNSIILLGPITSAFACWMAGRDQRRGMLELLQSTSRPPGPRLVASWAGSAAWALVAYAMVCLVYGSLTAWKTDWGGPEFATIAVGFSTLLAYSAVGFAVGTWIPFRVAAPLTGIGLFVAQAIVTYTSSTVQHLSPIAYESSATSVFHESRIDFHVSQIVWLLGIAVVALSAAVVHSQKDRTSIGVLNSGALITAIGAVMLFQIDGLDAHGQAVPYSPTCLEASIPTCLHPAYEPLHAETVDIIDRLMMPILGLEGAPTRAEQRSGWEAANSAGDSDVLTFHLHNVAKDGAQYADGGFHYFAGTLTQQIVNFGYWYETDIDEELRDPRPVLANWLLVQADIPWQEQISQHSYAVHGFWLSDEQHAALDRFTSLSGSEQRTWLEANLVDLRNGALTLDDLP